MRHLLLSVTLTLLIHGAFGASLFGIVADNSGQPLPFANIYIKETTKGTTANKEGRYNLELAPGGYDIVFQFIGYSKKIIRVDIGTEDKELNIMLSPEDIQLKEVIVKPTEDPAYAIIRNAIAKRDYHYNQIESYSCSAYTKGLQRIVSAPEKIFGIPINADGTLDSNNAGIIYLSESVSELSFKKPDFVSEKVISSKVSGDSRTFTWNRAGDFYIFNFYKNNIKLDFLSDRVFISPIADNAMLYYRYRLDGIITDNNRIINKIEVTPRRKNDPAFTGTIYIVDNTWEIHSLDFYLTKNNQMNFIDTLWMKQVYAPVQDSLWMQLSQWFEFNFDILKIKAEGYYGIVYSDYIVNPEFNRRDFNNEVLTVEEGANKKDSLYWEQSRPVPLTEEEMGDYQRKDSIETLKASKEYLRKIDRKNNKFSGWDLLLGYNLQNSYRNLYVNFIPIVQCVQYNTVEGFNVKAEAEISKEFDKKRMFSLKPVIRYGISNRHFNSTLLARYDYKPEKLGYIEAEGGRYVYQFNRAEPVSEIVNSFYSLFIGRNYMKIFEESFVRVTHRTEIANGLTLWSNAGFAFRNSLDNTSSVSVKEGEKLKFGVNDTFPGHEAFLFSFTLQYRPGQKFISRPNEKIFLGSKWPSFSLTWRKSIPDVFGSDMNYDQLEFKVSDKITLGMFGNTAYMAKLGMFLNDSRVELTDKKHFNGNQTVFGSHYHDGFQLLDYYAASTTNPYVEVHFQHSFDGFFFNKIPGFRKLKFQETFGVHFFYSEDFKDYTELSVGIENILRVIRVDFVFSLSSKHPDEFGVRVGIDLKQL